MVLRRMRLTPAEAAASPATEPDHHQVLGYRLGHVASGAALLSHAAILVAVLGRRTHPPATASAGWSARRQQAAATGFLCEPSRVLLVIFAVAVQLSSLPLFVLARRLAEK